MNTKFETNVASEIPRTKMSQEPGLPWKISSEDLEQIASMEDEHKLAVTGVPPLKTRAVFLVLLLVAIFFTIIYFVSMTVMENQEVQTKIQRKEAAVSALKTDFEKMNTEKRVLSESVDQLEKRVRDLSAQKELFTTVLETLTKKGDSSQVEKASEEKAP